MKHTVRQWLTRRFLWALIQADAMGWERAEHSAARASNWLTPEHPWILGALGRTEYNLGLHKAAYSHLEQAIYLNPEMASTWSVLGRLLYDQRRYEEAGVAYVQALKLDPTSALTRLLMVRSLLDFGRYDDARTLLEEATSLHPEWPNTHVEHAWALLRDGDIAQGFQEFEWRLQWANYKKKHIDRPLPRIPRWDGSPLHGKTILLIQEQGHGDTIHFLRYVPLVVDRGGRVIIACRRSLKRLAEHIPGVCSVVTWGRPHADVWAPMMSLAHILGTTLETIPNAVPYLNPAPKSMVTIPGHGTDRLKIGLVWGVDVKTPDELKRRNCPLIHFKPLFELPGIDWYSLQVGPRKAHIMQLGLASRIHDLSPQLHDFSDTAAAIAQLDLIITVDTAVAHLAGALGRPVWVLLPFKAYWQWMRDRRDSPWYPTMRLYRQSQPWVWIEPIQEVRSALEEILEYRTGGLLSLRDGALAL